MLQVGETREVLSVSFPPAREALPAVLPREPTLAQIRAFQDLVASCPQIEPDVEHYFSPGQYTRVCKVKAGTTGVGKMHRHQHPTFLMSGTARINTDRGMETITGPHVWISQPNAKRALVAITDCVFATVHLNPTDTRDLAVIEAEVIVPEDQIDYHAPALEFADNLQEVYA